MRDDYTDPLDGFSRPPPPTRQDLAIRLGNMEQRFEKLKSELYVLSWRQF